MTRGMKAQPGDTRLAKNGYHYTRTEEVWELTHRIILEGLMERKIRSDERVRFLDGDRSNLGAENLEVYYVRKASSQTKIARLESKKDDIIAELNELYAEIGEAP